MSKNIIVCVDKNEGGLTLNKKYEVLGSFIVLEVKYYTICDDHDFISDYHHSYFKTIDELRDDKLNKLGI